MDRPTALHPDVAGSLLLAVIASSHAPLLLLDGALTVIAASDSFCQAFGLASEAIAGCTLGTLGLGEWKDAELTARLRDTVATGKPLVAYEFDLTKDGAKPRRIVLNVQRLDYAGSGNVRLMLAAIDVTEARLNEKLRDDLLRDKGILLQELQHRVANSLQIIASVLLQSARRVQSEETRGHLHDAHNRVMSIAALQQQLAASTLDDVALRAYFSDLCHSIGASMIRDHDQLTLDVTTDESVAGADVSVSLGLIVTELVINALKHAFPEHRPGHIVVGYESHGRDWSLSVSDDGIGMPAVQAAIPAGLGTSIVAALAHKLDATIEVTANDPGTRVSVAHTESAPSPVTPAI